eukprot:1622554-Rhodomonas_salina.1
MKPLSVCVFAATHRRVTWLASLTTVSYACPSSSSLGSNRHRHRHTDTQTQAQTQAQAQAHT